MRIGLFRQPVFFIARRLAHPMLNRFGINNNRLDTYNNLWDITTDVTRNGGFLSSLYTNWQLRRLLLGRNSVNNFNNNIRQYIHLDNNMINMLNRLVNSSYGEIVPFIRQINYMILSIIGNIGLLFFKNFLRTTFLGVMYSLFTALSATIGILWIPSLADVTSFLNFALRMKSFFDYYLSFLPGNLSLPLPEWLKIKVNFGFNLEYLKYIIPILGYQVLDWFSFNWLFDLLNSILPFDLNIISFLFKPLKALLFYSGWYYIKDYVNENNLDIVTKFIFKIKDSLLKYFRRNNINPNNINPNNIKIVQNKNYKNYKNRFLVYLFKEFNLFE